MKTLLVLAPTPGLADALRAALPVEQYRVLFQAEFWQAEPLLRGGSVDACMLDAELTDIQPIRVVEQVRAASAACPIFIFAAAKQWEWEEEAYLLGVAHILEKPVRARLVVTLLDRLWPPGSGSSQSLAVTAPAPVEVRALEIAPGPQRTLEVLRGFSGVLTQTLNAQEMLKQFLLQLREILGVNRAAIFLRPPTGTASARGDRGLLSACAIGVAPGLLEHFTLTLQSGIGAHLHRQGRILQREGPAAQADREIQREFELLGAQVAVPIFDHQSLIGAAVFDGRLTGQPFTNDELNQVFQLLEQLGLAIKNTWAHDQLAASHQMMADILSQLDSACLVVGADLKLLHANRAARAYFLKPGGARTDLEFGDLPQALGSKVFQVLNTGLGLEPFKYRLPGVEVNTFQVVIVPFKRQSAASPNAAMLLMEDITQSERSQQLEIETANLRLVKSMAERLAHEIGNAIVPLSTHEQLLKQKYADPEFRASLAAAMGESVKRISRLAKQMFFLARETFERSDVVPLQQLVEEAFKEAQNFHSGKVARLHLDTGAQRLSLSVEKGGIRHALSEVMLNALQASSGDSLVSVNAHSKTDAAGQSWTQIEVSDPGAGFGLESARQALNPFYTTRSVGIGLGLTVARKIIEMHHGRIEIAPAEKNHPSTVIISLPNN